MERTGVKQLGVRFDGKVWHIVVWAPLATQVSCRFFGIAVTIPLQRQQYGYWHTETTLVLTGERYKIIVDDQELPDPISLSQPDGVHGASEVLDLSFSWTDQDYRPPAQSDLIIYELHVGTFTTTNDFDGVIEKIPYLKNLGITAIEIMPVAQFPGERNWGYDGVYLSAVQHSYGGAKGLQKLVDACHQAQIAVILDVVYNHLGPEGNYLPYFGPYFTDKYHTPWGDAVNYDDRLSHGMRDLVLNNVRMWFEDFHIDGLRMDAVHAIKDFSAAHILQHIRQETDDIMIRTGKHRFLFVECDLNDRRFLEPLTKNGFGMDAQWLDEFHHALRVSVGEARIGYYEEFNGIAHLAKAYKKGYVFDGCYSSHRQKFFGSNTHGLGADRFIVFCQNHDQVGNRMLGERASTLYSVEKNRLMAFAVLISPYLPLLFMGEEWGTKKSFSYFISHGDPNLVELVRQGRKEEFRDFQSDHDVPDPQAEITFQQAVLNWSELGEASNKRHLDYYKALIALRKNNSLLKNVRWENLRVDCQEEKHVLVIHFEEHDQHLVAIMNFSDRTQQVCLPPTKQWTLEFDTNIDLGQNFSKNNALDTSTLIILPWTGAIYISLDR